MKDCDSETTELPPSALSCHSPFYPLPHPQPSWPGLFFTLTGYLQRRCGHVPFFVPSSLCVPKRAMLISLPGTACVTPVAVVSADLRRWQQPCICVYVRMCVWRRALPLRCQTDVAACCPCTSLVIFSPQQLIAGPFLAPSQPPSIALCFFPFTLECFEFAPRLHGTEVVSWATAPVNTRDSPGLSHSFTDLLSTVFFREH